MSTTKTQDVNKQKSQKTTRTTWQKPKISENTQDINKHEISKKLKMSTKTIVSQNQEIKKPNMSRNLRYQKPQDVNK